MTEETTEIANDSAVSGSRQERLVMHDRCLCGNTKFKMLRDNRGIEKCTRCGGMRVAKKKIDDAEARGNKWLADGNAAAEAGNQSKAEECYRKGQYWLDKYNAMTGRA